MPEAGLGLARPSAFVLLVLVSPDLIVVEL